MQVKILANILFWYIMEMYLFIFDMSNILVIDLGKSTVTNILDRDKY